MSTQTLKARPGGAQEAQSASVELPAPILPTKAKLARVLADYEKAAQDLEDARGHLSRSETDEQTALNNEDLGDDEIGNRVAVAQRSISIYRARVANREKSIAAISKELAVAINQSTPELRSLTNAETERREKIIGERVVAALQVGNAVDPARMKKELADLLQFCGPIQMIWSLAPSLGFVQGTAESLVSVAREILGKYERVIAESGRKL